MDLKLAVLRIDDCFTNRCDSQNVLFKQQLLYVCVERMMDGMTDRQITPDQWLTWDIFRKTVIIFSCKITHFKNIGELIIAFAVFQSTRQ